MPHTLQDFLVTATNKAAAYLETALLRLPEDQRGFTPTGKERTALDMVAECALINVATVNLIQTRVFPDFDWAQFERDKASLSEDVGKMLALLKENSAKVADAIAQVPDEDLGIQVAMPWGPMTVAEILAYAYWNMSYHEGQINYIASILGCLSPPGA